MKRLVPLVALALFSSCAPNAPGDHSGGAGGGGSGGSGGAAGGGGSGGGGPMAKPDWVSGSRIRARLQTTPDGAKAFVGWYDAMLDTPCLFQIASDGQQRCLPTNYYATVGTYYSDMNCSVPLAAEPPQFATGCAPKYAIKQEAAGSAGSVCSDFGYPQPPTHIYSVAAEFTGTVYTFSGVTPMCGAVPGSTYTTFKFFDVNGEVPATMFAAGSIVTE